METNMNSAKELNQEPMTVYQVLLMTRDELRTVKLDVEQVYTIGVPVANAINNLNLCIEAMKREEQAKMQEKHEPEIEIVECGAAEELPEDADPDNVIELPQGDVKIEEVGGNG